MKLINCSNFPKCKGCPIENQGQCSFEELVKSGKILNEGYSLIEDSQNMTENLFPKPKRMKIPPTHPDLGIDISDPKTWN